MDRLFFGIGSALGALAVVIGAFGAHGLKDRLDASMLAVFETGARYHLVHALAVIAAAWAAQRWPASALPAWAGWLFVAGIVLFSGSLYALALTGVKALGMVAPLGGLAFIAAWTLLAVAAFRNA